MIKPARPDEIKSIIKIINPKKAFIYGPIIAKLLKVQYQNIENNGRRSIVHEQWYKNPIHGKYHKRSSKKHIESLYNPTNSIAINLDNS